MQKSKYPWLHRLNREVQEITHNPTVDGFIGQNTEDYLARAMTGFDGVSIIAYLADLAHKQVEQEDVDVKKEDRLEPLPAKDRHLAIARSYIGLKEIVGKEHNPKIVEFFKRCGLSFIKDDETPWCAVYVGACLEEAGIKSSRRANARSYLNYGIRCTTDPVPAGAIAVFWRVDPDGPYGHVGFVNADHHRENRYVDLLGGNQGNKVCVKNYPASRLLDFRLPARFKPST